MDESITQEPQPVVVKKKTWKDKIAKTTKLSKALTLVLFVILPIFGFWLGSVFTSVHLEYVHSCESCEMELIGCSLQNQQEKMKVRETMSHPLSFIGVSEDTKTWIPVISDDASGANMQVVSANGVRSVALEGELWRSTIYYNCGDELPINPFEIYKTMFLAHGWGTDVVTGNNLSVRAIFADGPLGSAEGYVKVSGDTVQAVKLGYNKEYFNTCEYKPDDPNSTCPLYEKMCPLNIEFEIFVSDVYPLEKVYDKVGVIEQ